jgi:hypothetical protein
MPEYSVILWILKYSTEHKGDFFSGRVFVAEGFKLARKTTDIIGSLHISFLCLTGN